MNKLAAARVCIYNTWPFLYSAASKLIPIISYDCESNGYPTMGVDKRWRFYVHPDYIENTDIQTLALMIAGHELQHLILEHFARLEYVGNADIQNMAGDFAINSNLIDYCVAGEKYRKTTGATTVVFDIPKYILHPENHGLKSKLTSEEYAALIKKKNIECSCHTCGSGAGGTPFPCELGDEGSGVSDAEQVITIRELAGKIKEQKGKLPGTIPGDMERLAEFILTPPKVNWKRQLAAMIREAVTYTKGQGDYSWLSRSKRNCDPFRIPGTKMPIPVIKVIQDVSGSMTKEDINRCMSELQSIARSCRVKITIVQCDTRITKEQKISSVKDIKKLRGGGGTDMAAGMKSAAELKPKADILVILTDGYTGWPAVRPRGVKRAIACITRNNADKPPSWIKTVYAELD